MEILPGEDTGAMTRFQREEKMGMLQLSEFQVSSYSEESIMYEIRSPEPVESDESPLSSPSVESSTTRFSSTLAGGNYMHKTERRCDYPNCGRLFPKRHELK